MRGRRAPTIRNYKTQVRHVASLRTVRIFDLRLILLERPYYVIQSRHNGRDALSQFVRSQRWHVFRNNTAVLDRTDDLQRSVSICTCFFMLLKSDVRGRLQAVHFRPARPSVRVGRISMLE